MAKLLPIKKFVLTLTSDNGKEFASHELISTMLEADFYFANPYHGIPVNKFSELFLAHIFSASRSLRNHQVTNFRAAIPDPDFNIIIQRGTEIIQYTTGLDNYL